MINPCADPYVGKVGLGENCSGSGRSIVSWSKWSHRYSLGRYLSVSLDRGIPMSKIALLTAALLASLSLAACGSSTEKTTSTSSAEMPDVVGQSLTSAKSTLEAEGVAWEASDSAAADDTDGYDVCATVPEPGRPAPAGDSPAKLKVAKSFECDDSKEDSNKAATSDSSSADEAASDVETGSGDSGKIKVPNVVGKSHQFGQDAMQEAGLYMLAEEDATGQDRMLLLDRNWVVVKQRPKAGSRVSEDTTITLYSKKYTD